VRTGALLRLGVATGALLLTLTACGDEPPEGPLGKGGESSSSPSASASPTATAPTPPAATDDARGREAFARWFVQAFSYAFATNDAAPINAVAATEKGVECGTCSLFTDYLATRKSDGVTVQPSEYVVKKVFESGRDKGAAIYTLVTERPAYANVKADGTVVDKHPADKAYLIEVGLRYHDGAYELTGWTAGKKTEG
jgi:hypothetical protein